MTSSTPNRQDIDMKQLGDDALSIAAALGGSPVSSGALQGPRTQDYLRRLEAVQQTDEYAALRASLAAGDIQIDEYHRGVGALLEKVGSATA
jgi:hypothetical protein